jgi:hypothetical protein
MAFGGIMIPNEDDNHQILEIDEYPSKKKDKSKSKKPPKTTVSHSRTGGNP